MPNEDEDDLGIVWDDLTVAAPRREPQEGPLGSQSPRDLVIGTSANRILVRIKPDGRIEYGPDYTPDEAAVVFWEEMGRRRLEMEERLLLIQHMEAVLTRLGAADLRNEAATNQLRERQSQDNLLAAQTAQRNLERAMHQAIELGRGLARRPDVLPPQPTRIPAQIRDNPDSSYGEESDEG